MGLVSLPFLNRAGVYAYWGNVWDSVFNYRNYYFFEIFINFFFYRFFQDLTFNFLFKFFQVNKYKSKSGYLNYVRGVSSFDLSIYSYLGKIWLFLYQGWYIIKIVMLIPSKEIKKSLTKSINLLKINKIFIRRIKNIKYYNKYSCMNYKYRI